MFININSYQSENTAELHRLQEQLQFDVLILCETYQKEISNPTNFNMATIRLKELLPRWTKVDLPCPCPGGRHGMLICLNPFLELVETRPVILCPTTGKVDHQQISVVVRTPTGEVCNLIGVHYQPGEKPFPVKAAFKVLQFAATARHLQDFPDTNIIIVGGDYNLSPSWKMWGQMVGKFHPIGLMLESFTQIWNADKTNRPWTNTKTDPETGEQVPANFIDHIATRTPVGYKSCVKLRCAPEFRITSDHPNFLQVEIWSSPHYQQKQHKIPYFLTDLPHYCRSCGAGYNQKHLNCQGNDIRSIEKLYLKDIVNPAVLNKIKQYNKRSQPQKKNADQRARSNKLKRERRKLKRQNVNANTFVKDKFIQVPLITSTEQIPNNEKSLLSKTGLDLRGGFIQQTLKKFFIPKKKIPKEVPQPQRQTQRPQRQIQQPPQEPSSSSGSRLGYIPPPTIYLDDSDSDSD